jgi:hypothetical protein
MRLRAINIIEVFLAVVFITTYFLTQQKVADLAYVAFFDMIFLAVLYFPFGFYTLRSTEYNIVYSIVFGIIFSISLVGIAFSLSHIDISIVLLFLMLTIFLMAAVMQAVVYYFLDNKKDVNILFYNKALTIRYLLFFVLMIYSVVTYDFRN